MKLSLKGCRTLSTLFAVLLGLTVSAGMARGQGAGAGAPGAGGSHRGGLAPRAGQGPGRRHPDPRGRASFTGARPQGMP